MILKQFFNNKLGAGTGKIAGFVKVRYSSYFYSLEVWETQKGKSIVKFASSFCFHAFLPVGTEKLLSNRSTTKKFWQFDPKVLK